MQIRGVTVQIVTSADRGEHHLHIERGPQNRVPEAAGLQMVLDIALGIPERELAIDTTWVYARRWRTQRRTVGSR
jgi:hypothetical protein